VTHDLGFKVTVYLQVEYLLGTKSGRAHLRSAPPPLSVWPHLFRDAGREKRRGEQLKWSLAFRLYIGSFPCAQLPGPVHIARLGSVFCVFSLGLYFVYSFVLFDLFVCSYFHHSHTPSHIHCSIPGSKLTFSTNLFHHSLLAPTWTAFSDYTRPDLLKLAQRFSILV